MPELPEVENVARTLRPRLLGRVIERVETSGLALRKPIDVRKLRAAAVHATVESVERVGKYLVVPLSSGHALVAHLGMTGRLVFAAPDEELRAHTHVRFSLSGALELRYVDARRFGSIAAYKREALATSPELHVLGVDPLSAAFTVEELAEALAGARRDLKAFLLDQGRIAGLGNIYACEALFEAGLSPRRRAHRVGSERAGRLHQAIVEVLERGIANRGTSFSDYVDAEGAQGSNQDALWVYGREGAPCKRCKTPIKRVVQGGRSTFYCPRCQR